MKTLVCSTLVVAALAGTTLQSAQENATKPEASEAHACQRVALIDMAKVFRETRSFVDGRAEIQLEVKRTNGLDKQMATVISALEKALKQIAEGTTEYANSEKELIKLKREREDFRRKHQRQFVVAEAELFKSTYFKTVEVIRTLSKTKGYSLVLRFDSTEIDPSDPQKMIKQLNRQVVYHEPQDDITDQVIEALNAAP